MENLQLEFLKKKYGLSYHIDFTNFAQQAIGLTGKRVLEVGGSLPSDFVLTDIGANQWVSLEEPNYWDETLATGFVLGTPPDMNSPRRYFTDATPDSMGAYNVLFGRIEDLPKSLQGHFDVVFSIAAFEHIHKLAQAIDKMHAALRPGGKLFSLFSPVWSAHDGHHLPEIKDKHGQSHNFASSLIPPWGHLIMRPMEMFDYLMKKTDDRQFSQEVVYYVYQSSHINRFFLDDFIEIVKRGPFRQIQVTPVFEASIPEDVRLVLESKYPKTSNFSHNGLLLILERT